MKICIIGAGSTYTPELIEGLINKRDTLPLTELYLMDIDDRKLSIVGNLAKRMIEHSELNCKVVLTKDYEEALMNAEFVLCQIRVGKLPARQKDERIPLKYNLIGQETCGMGGMFKAFRTIPAMLKIVKLMEKCCPNAWLINFSNPSGLLAQALLNHTNVKMMGLCNVPLNMIDGIKRKLNLPKEAKIEYFGLNHFTYVTSIEYNGKDYLNDALEAGLNSDAMKNIPASGFSAEQIKAIGGIPSSYLEYYYFKDSKLEKLKHAEKCRAEVCMELEEQLLDLYSQPTLYVKPEQLSKRGGARYSEVAISLVNAIYNDLQEVHAVNILNNGAIDFLRDDDAVEVLAVVGKDGAKPLKVTHYTEHIKEYIQAIKAYERHAVNASITGDREEAMRAMIMNPLMNDLNTSKACFEEMLEAHKEYLPQFFKDEK